MRTEQSSVEAYPDDVSAGSALVRDAALATWRCCSAAATLDSAGHAGIAIRENTAQIPEACGHWPQWCSDCKLPISNAVSNGFTCLTN